MTCSSSPCVVIAGGGPSGLVAAILLGKRGIPVTVVERSSKPDEWSTKSYSIVLGPRGLAALATAGCLEQAREQGMKRSNVIFHGVDGSTRVIPKKNTESLGFSRPLLVECLEAVAREQPNVKIRKGTGVKSVTTKEEENDTDVTLQVILEDDSTLEATHVIGADGKWSRLRSSFPESFPSTIRTEPSFGVHVMVPSVPPNWETDGTHVVQPAKECMFYVIAAPIPTGELSVSLVAYDEILQRYPWLSPPEDLADEQRNGDWTDEYSARPAVDAPENNDDDKLADKLAAMLEKELPSFLNDIGRECLSSARINRRVSWVKMENPCSESEINFATSDGRVVLIGDAAHAVTPSMGEGCNLAMESAAALVDSIPDGATVDDLSAAFIEYGKSRPLETKSVQHKSAMACRYATRQGA